MNTNDPSGHHPPDWGAGGFGLGGVAILAALIITVNPVTLTIVGTVVVIVLVILSGAAAAMGAYYFVN